MVAFYTYTPQLSKVGYAPVMYFETHLSSMLLSLKKELLDCDDLHSVIRLVLKAGNYMNSVGVLLT